MKDSIYNALNLSGFFSISKKQLVKLIKELEKKKMHVYVYIHQILLLFMLC